MGSRRKRADVFDRPAPLDKTTVVHFLICPVGLQGCRRSARPPITQSRESARGKPRTSRRRTSRRRMTVRHPSVQSSSSSLGLCHVWLASVTKTRARFAGQSRTSSASRRWQRSRSACIPRPRKQCLRGLRFQSLGSDCG